MRNRQTYALSRAAFSRYTTIKAVPIIEEAIRAVVRVPEGKSHRSHRSSRTAVLQTRKTVPHGYQYHYRSLSEIDRRSHTANNGRVACLEWENHRLNQRERCANSSNSIGMLLPDWKNEARRNRGDASTARDSKTEPRRLTETKI